MAAGLNPTTLDDEVRSITTEPHSLWFKNMILDKVKALYEFEIQPPNCHKVRRT